MDDMTVSVKTTQWQRGNHGPAGHEVGAVKPLQDVHDLRALKKACRDFESIFIYTLLKAMRASLPNAEGTDAKGEIYTSMGDIELSRSLAYGGGLGFGDLLFDALKNEVP